MKKDDQVKTTGHVYDGIEELDHPAPNWFTSLFYISIVFGIGYFTYYTLGDGPSLITEYERAKRADEVLQHEHLAKSGGLKAVSEDDLRAYLKDPQKKKLGATAFQAKCVSCHGAQGQGGIGPNLTDAYWLHGGKMSDVLVTINKGVPDKGMPPWGGVISPEEAQNLVVYIRSIGGSNPPGAKAPQGELVKSE